MWALIWSVYLAFLFLCLTTISSLAVSLLAQFMMLGGMLLLGIVLFKMSWGRSDS